MPKTIAGGKNVFLVQLTSFTSSGDYTGPIKLTDFLVVETDDEKAVRKAIAELEVHRRFDPCYPPIFMTTELVSLDQLRKAIDEKRMRVESQILQGDIPG